MSQSKPEQAQNISGKNNNATTSLQTRLVVFVLLIALVPLIIVAIRDTLQTQEALTNIADISLKSGATQTANSLDNFIQITLDAIAVDSQFADFTAYLTSDSLTRPNVQEHALDFLKTLVEDNPYITSCALVDTTGNVLLDSIATNIQHDESGETYYAQVQSSDEPIVSAVSYSDDKIPSITFANKIVDGKGDYVGILRIKYDPAVFQDAITKSIGSATDTSVLLLDQLHIRMADSRNPELILKSITPLESADYELAVSTHRFLNIPREEQATNYLNLELALDNAASQPLFRADISPSTTGDDTVAVATLKTLPWTIAYSRPTSILLEDVQKQIRINVILVITASVLIIIIATLVARNFTRPIISLTETANSISLGNLSARAKINATDEIGSLANTFNSMAEQIQDLITGLEQRVEQRTSELEHRSLELEEASKQSEKRAGELQTIAEVARYISTEKELERLLPLITQTVSERFGFYHVGIFLLNENRKFAVLRAANSPGGQKMLERQHKLEVGQVGIVGNVTSTGNPRIALDTGADAAYFNNPDLPQTHSEMALPLTARGIIIGALDVQSTAPNAFTDTDITTLGLLADQIAIAIDNVRLLEESKNALDESQSVFREYLADAWQKKSTSEIIGYHQTLTGGQVITGKDSKEVNAPVNAERNMLTVPIKLRDQTIGTLNIRPNTEGRAWSTDEINIVQAITERLGLALDNARLFEETTRRAEREHLVSDITTKIRSTTDPQEMVKTAIEELKRALGVTRVEIVPQKTAPSPDK